MALPWVPQWEEKAEESHCDFQFSLPPQVQSSQFVQGGAHSLPVATQPQDTESWTLFTNGTMLKTKPQPGLFPLLVHCGCTSKSRCSSNAGIPIAQKKGSLPFLLPPALCWALRHHTELILISCLNSPRVLAMLCHQTAAGVCWERLACGQARRETHVIYGAEKVPATCRVAGMQRFAKQAHLVMRKLPSARPGTQQADEQ